MLNLFLPRALDFIKANQNPDGGWGYRPDRNSLVEPTGLCLLALKAGGDKAAMAKGLDFLRACLKGSGAVGIDPRDPEGSWMAYAALLAFHDLGAGSEESRLRDWILSFEDASNGCRSSSTPISISTPRAKSVSRDVRSGWRGERLAARPSSGWSIPSSPG